MENNLMHIISDEEYRAYIELTKVVRAFVEPWHGDVDLFALNDALKRAVEAHNKRLNTLRRTHGT